MWPVCFVVIGLGLRGLFPVGSAVEIGAWLLPALLEYCAVGLGRMAYHPQRTWIFGTLMGVGAGRLLHRYLVNPSDPLTWGMGALCLGAGLLAVAWQGRG